MGVLGGLELTAFGFFHLFRERLGFFDLGDHLATLAARGADPHELSRQALRFDPALGWDVAYDTAHGERPRARDYGRPLVATFGDSYTHCDQVGHDETWQTGLAELLQGDVYNFGISGAGPDQAYLKYVSLDPRPATPVVTLGIISENINRILSVYRPFYYPRTGIRLTKPRFELVEGRLRLLENPIRSVDELTRLSDPAFLARIGAHDDWYEQDDYPELGFPYLRILFNRRMWLELVYGRLVKGGVNDTNPTPWVDHWRDPEASALMFAILDAFVAEATREGQTPVLMLLPMEYQVVAMARTGRSGISAAALLEHCTARGYLCFDGVSALASRAGSPEAVKPLYHDHLTALGNRWLAEAFADFLRRVLADRLDGQPGSAG